MTTIIDDLFSPVIKYIDVFFWEFGHTMILKPEQVPAGISQHELERRAVCRCGTGWPQVTRFPKKIPITM